jgi:predicted nucleic acid-binding protein
MLRAVVDTNILIRAVIMPSGTVGSVITRLQEGDYTLVYSQPLMDELLEKLALPRIRKKYHRAMRKKISGGRVQTTLRQVGADGLPDRPCLLTGGPGVGFNRFWRVTGVTGFDRPDG